MSAGVGGSCWWSMGGAGADRDAHSTSSKETNGKVFAKKKSPCGFSGANGEWAGLQRARSTRRGGLGHRVEMTDVAFEPTTVQSIYSHTQSL
jgi:hypothetical protein